MACGINGDSSEDLEIDRLLPSMIY